MQTSLKFLFLATLMVGIFWLAGFFYFIYTLPLQPTNKDLAKTDAIVVWTGGGCRVATGLELLADGLSDRLFISGVYRDNETKEGSDKSDHLGGGLIEPPAPWPSKDEAGETNLLTKFSIPGVKGWDPLKVFAKSCSDCHIDLNFDQIRPLLEKIYIGHQAKTTIGNAIETARWAQENNIRSIRLVTSPMHIPRSLIECRRYLSAITVVVHPVELNKFNHRHWYKDWRIAYKVALEYSKYLSILMGLRIQRQENLYGEL